MYNKSILIMILPLVLITFATAGFKFPDGHDAVIQPAVMGILECRFDDVLRFTDSVFLADSENPLAATLHLAALGMRDVDFDTMADSAAFMRSFERAGDAVNAYEKIHGTNSYVMMLRGFVLGMHASFHLKNKSYFAAAGTGLDAIKAMKEAQKLDSTNTEVNFFLGLYDYGKADLKKRLPGVTFWLPGDKNTGIRLLEQCAQSAVLTGTAAKLALSDIYAGEGQAQKSREIIFVLKKEIPNSRFLLWAEAKYFENQKMHAQAAAVYGRLADSYDKGAVVRGKLADSYDKKAPGKYNSAATRNKQAHLHHRAGEKALAVNACKLILELHGGDGDKRINAIIKDTEKLLKRLER